MSFSGSKAPEKKPAPGGVVLPTAEWMFADSGSGTIGFQAFAHLNPLRWSGALSFKDCVRQLEDLAEQCANPDSEAKMRPILLKCPAASTGRGTEYKDIREAIDFLKVKQEEYQRTPYSQKVKDQALKTGAAILGKVPKVVTEKLDTVDLKGVPKELVALGVAFVPVVILIFVAPELILLLLGTVYPAYATLLCLAENKTGENQQWTIYWVFFTVINFDFVAYIISWIPFSYYLKMGTIIFLCMSQKGARILIEKVMKPYIFPMIF